MNQTHKYLIFLSMMVAPSLVWAQQAPDEEAVAEEVTVDEGSEAGDVVGEDEVAEPSASEVPEPTEETAVDAAAATEETAVDAAAATEETTIDAAAETEEIAPAAPSTTSSDATDWSYTPRSTEPEASVDESAPAQVVPAVTSAASESVDEADDQGLYPRYVRLHLAGVQQFSTSDDLAAVSEGDSMGMGTFGVGVRVAPHIGVELNYVSGETSDAVFADTDATFSVAGADARARFDYALFRFFRVYGAVGIGARSATIEVNTSSDTVSQQQLGFAASLVGGVELAWIGRKFGVGAFYEGGYALQTPYNFDNARFEEGDNEGVDLGSIFLHGATQGGGLFVAAYF